MAPPLAVGGRVGRSTVAAARDKLAGDEAPGVGDRLRRCEAVAERRAKRRARLALTRRGVGLRLVAGGAGPVSHGRRTLGLIQRRRHARVGIGGTATFVGPPHEAVGLRAAVLT